MPLEIEIDGNKLEVPDGSTVMDAARIANIYVPHFCYHRKLSIAANCRMCLVQIEKAPKPMPACATPVTNGMKVMTHSAQAVTAQKGVMEFLLINHPLDCPICDQGGECQLQDLAVGYGGSGSKYEEDKRVVANKNLGPLISTDMTRCIHCTRCVRFGQEIAGVMELGMIGRGEHSEIITFVGKTVDSELSGNVIDLCPVGALTSKPFRYSARTWELTRKPSISPHCGLGSNLTLQIKQNRVMRALPRENEAINECWISDKDRFSYEALNSDQRLARPMLKQGGQWKEVDWQTALEFVSNELQRIKAAHGAASIGALATPHQTVEELYLLQKLVRGLDSDNIDFRLRQCDFSADGKTTGAPWLGMGIAEVSQLDRVLVVGSTLRKDHPLIAHRLRQAAKKVLKINLLHAIDDDLLLRVANKAIVAPAAMVDTLAQVVKAAATLKGVAVPAGVASVSVSDAAQRIAASLADGKNAAVFLGNFAQHHAQAAQLHALAQALAEITGAKLGVLGEAANSVGAYVAGAVPSTGKNARDMLAQPLKAYVLLGVEPELDAHNPAQAISAMKQAELVVALSSFQHKAVDYAHVLLPIAPFTETAGTFINTEGRAQSFQGVVQPLGETRPAWKVLRVLGNLLGLAGFEQQSADDVRLEALGQNNEKINKNNVLTLSANVSGAAGGGVQRIAETPIYAADALVRRAPSLQKTRDGQPPFASMNRALASKLGLQDGDHVRVSQGGGTAVVTYTIDDKLPAGCIRLAAARVETAGLGAASEPLTVERVAMQQKVGRVSAVFQPVVNFGYWLWALLASVVAWVFGNDIAPSVMYGIKTLLLIMCIVVPIMLSVAYLTLWERKVIGWIQLRLGPNRVGPLGLLQPIADGIKLFLKEIIVPSGSNKLLFVIAPIMAITPALAAWAVVPFDPDMVLSNIDASLLYIMAITSMGVYGVIIAGWASNSKYAFIGAMRSAAQIVSYEIAMGFALVGVLMAAQSLNLVEIVKNQQSAYGVFGWFWIPLFPLFLTYLIAGVAETNRAPFDVAEGESEIVAGFHVEYSGMTFAVFFLAEYANMILVSFLTALMFLGGWLSPFPQSWGVLGQSSFLWLLVKAFLVVSSFLWFRATFPRYRYDQIMRLGWKVFIPVTLVWIIVLGAWMQTPLWVWWK